jgi:glucan phosphoethanolaminetransferase (alkaline phosphatase superfamily)
MEGMGGEVIEEKLRRAKARSKYLQVLLWILFGGWLFTDILLLYSRIVSKSNHFGTNTVIKIVALFLALLAVVLLAIYHYNNLVKKYTKQLEESPKRKNELRRMALKSLDSRLAN